MCRRTQCSKCHKPTWAGCGAHVEQVLGDVRPADRCQCRATATATSTAKSAGTATAGRQSWLQKLRAK